MISETKQAVEKKNIVLENKLHNRFDIEVRDAITGEMKQKAQAFNIILDQFWTRLFANQSVYDYIQYGSGTGTPSASDTALFNWVAGAAASAYVYDDAHYAQGWNSFTRNIVLDEQTAVGVTITEVGLAGAANSGLCTHAMLQDMNGNPITITKTNTDIIIIYATVYIHWNVNGTNGVRYIPSSHWFGTKITASTLRGGKRLGGVDNIFDNTGIVPVGNSSTKTWTWSSWRVPIGSGNIYGIEHILPSAPGYTFEYIVDIDIKGTYQITGEAVGTGDGTTTDFSVAFDAPYDMTVYVDGVAQTSGVTISSSLKRTDIDFLYYMDKIDAQTLGAEIPTVSQPYPRYFYNPFYQIAGIRRIWNYNSAGYGYGSKLYASDDGVNWTPVVEDRYPDGYDIPSEYQYSKYWKEVQSGRAGPKLSTSITNQPYDIVFDAPPAVGAVITADYKTPFLPKDSNHVYDLSLTIQLGEYNNP